MVKVKPIKTMSKQDEQLARAAAVRLQEKQERLLQVKRIMAGDYK